MNEIEVFLILKKKKDVLETVRAGGRTTMNTVTCFSSLDSAKRSVAYHNRQYGSNEREYVVFSTKNGLI